MKKVLISHIPNTLNYGSAMMAINLIAGLRQRFGKKVEIFCDCDGEDLRRLMLGADDFSLKSFIPASPGEGESFFICALKLMLGRRPDIQLVQREFCAMIVLGGDDLSEVNQFWAIALGIRYAHINSCCKVILAGQSLGPFYGLFRWVARLVFRKMIVFTRDDSSYDFSKQKLKIKKIYKSKDLAFLPLPGQDKWNDILCNYNLVKNTYIVIVPSGLVRKYTDDISGYIDTWVSLVETIKWNYPSLRIVLLAHVLKPDYSSDKSIIDEIYIKAKEGVLDKNLIITDEIQPAEARAVLGGAKYVVTGRMHAAVSSFQMGVPAISLAYSEKYFGVLGKGFELPELVVDCRNRKWGSQTSILNDVLSAIQNLEKEDTQTISKIKLRVKQNEKLVKRQIDLVAKEIIC